MFTIYGGKAAFDQWDTGQRVVNPEIAAGTKVIFKNCTGETHPMKAYSHDGEVVCDVPNDLLTTAMPLLVTLCDSEEHRTRLMVNAREKPEDYVYEDNTAYPQETGGAGCNCDSGELLDAVLEMLASAQVINPAADCDGALFTDESNKVYLI